MISILSANTYYFPKAEVIDKASFVLSLYSDLSKTNKDFQVSTNPGVSSSKYYPIVITQELIDSLNSGEYNYTLSDGDLVASKGLLRIVKDDSGEYDPETDYVIYNEDIDWITTEFVSSDALWLSGYTSGMTDGLVIGYNSGYTTGYQEGSVDGYASGYSAGYISGYTDGLNGVENYLWMRALTNDASISIVLHDATSASTQNIQYSFDKVDWVEWDFSEIAIESGDTVYFKGINPEGTRRSDGSYLQFVTSGLFDCGGSILTLIDGCGNIQTMEQTYKAFFELFKNTNIINAPNISIQTTGMYQYQNTFEGCQYLQKIPEMEIENITTGTFRHTFSDCLSLTEAVIEFDEITGYDTCWSMFRGCTSLSSVTSYIKTISGSTSHSPIENWMEGVAEDGDFYNLGGYEFEYNDSGIPSGWTEYVITEKKRIKYNGLILTSKENGSTVSMTYSNANIPSIQISYDGEYWEDWDFSAITLNYDEQVAFRGTSLGKGNSYQHYDCNFVMTGIIEAKGNIMSLVDNGACTATTIPNEYYFCNLFDDCTALTKAPKLPATGLTQGCYKSMFSHCTSLTTAPELPATTLAHACYQDMFYGCTNLKTAPILPATRLVNFCYDYMFRNCSKINKIVLYAETWQSGGMNFTTYWLDGVKTLGDFYNLGNLGENILPRGASGIPSRWTVHTQLDT